MRSASSGKRCCSTRRVSPFLTASLNSIAQRLAHEPVAYILGYRDFWTIRIGVGPGVLIPRPDSETLIEAAVAHFGPAGPDAFSISEPGPAHFCFAALSEWPAATGLGVDASDIALDYANDNALALGLGNRVELMLGDLGRGSRRPIRPHSLQPALYRRQ